MEMKQLEYFLAVCEEMHFTRAADKVRISQPSLSQQIRNLEYEVGTPLFDRIGKKIALTEAGKILKHHSQNIFYELNQSKNAIDELHGLERGALSVGCLYTVESYLISPAVIRFHKEYPNIRLSILGLPTSQIREGLLMNQLDLGILFLPPEDPELDSIPLFMEELCLIAPLEPAYEAWQDGIPMKQLAELPLVLLPDNFFIRQLLNDYSESLGFTIKPFLEMTTIEALVHMVESGMGCTVLPRSLMEHLQKDSVRVLPIINPSPTRRIGIVFRKEKYMCAATKRFIRELQENAAHFKESV
jgi:LysR family cyn operon transcriptional activator